MVGAEEPGVTTGDVSIARASLRRWLLAAWAAVALLGLGIELARYLLHIDPAGRWLWLFSLSHEHNIPTWYSSSLLMLSSVLLVLATLQALQNSRDYVWHWALLAVLMAYVSMDELIGFHEHANWIDGKGIFYYSWVIPGAVAVAVLGFVFWGFLQHLAAPTRRAFLTAAAVYVGGALGVELALGAWAEAYGHRNLGYGLIDFVEESLEILGVTLFLLALADHLHGASGAMGTSLRRRA